MASVGQVTSALSAANAGLRQTLNQVNAMQVVPQEYRPMMSYLSDVATQNTAASAQEAERLRSWQEQQNKIAMDFNMAEAAKNRSWQEYMSNTAHQREVADLKAAGLNPILSAMGGNGAAVGSGATASGVTSAGAKGEVDTSFSGALVGMLGTLISAQTQMALGAMSANTNLAVANKAAWASQYASDMAYAGTKFASTQTNTTQRWIAENYPNNPYSAMAGLMGAIFGDDPSDVIHDSTLASLARGFRELFNGFGNDRGKFKNYSGKF